MKYTNISDLQGIIMSEAENTANELKSYNDVIEQLMIDKVIMSKSCTADKFIVDANEKTEYQYIFKNSKGTGILDILKKEFDFDLKRYKDSGTPKEVSDMLCLLKYLTVLDRALDIPLLKVLADPSLAEIKILGFKEQDDYKHCLDEVKSQVRMRLSDVYADKCDRLFSDVCREWCSLRVEIFELVIDSYMMLLKDAYMQRFTDPEEEIWTPKMLKAAENYAETNKISIQRAKQFYQLFGKYELKRYFNDKKVIDEIQDSCRSSQKLENIFQSWHWLQGGIAFIDLERMIKLHQKRLTRVDGALEELDRDILFMIQEGVNAELNEADYRFAVKYLKKVAKWWCPENYTQTHILTGNAVVILQELAYLNNSKKKFEYQYNRNEKAKTFSAYIKSDIEYDFFVIVMRQRLSERFLEPVDTILAT